MLLWAAPEPHRLQQWFRRGVSNIRLRPGFPLREVAVVPDQHVPDVIGVVEQAEGPTQKAQANDVAVFARTLREEAEGVLLEI
jgi:hypothetical protein